MRSQARAHKQVDGLIVAGEFARAEAKLNGYLRRFPADPVLHLRLGHCLMVKDGNEAKRQIDTAVSLAGDDVELLLKAAQMMMTLDAELGREYAIRAAELGPASAEDQARLAYLRGRYSEADGAPEAAEGYFADAVRLDPRDPIYAEYLVGLLWRAGRATEARAVSDKALQTVFKRDTLDAQRSRLDLG